MDNNPIYVCLVQSLSRVRLFATPWIAAHQASLSITNSWSLLKLMSIELVMPSSHLIFSHPILLPPSVFIYVCVYTHIYIYILLNHLAVHMKCCGSTIIQLEKTEHYLVPAMWIGHCAEHQWPCYRWLKDLKLLYTTKDKDGSFVLNNI